MKNKKNTFRFTKNGKLYPSLLTRAIFNDVEKNVPELLLGRIHYSVVIDNVISRVSDLLSPDEAKTIFEVNGGKKTVATYLLHLSDLGNYNNGLTKTNEEVIEMFLAHKKAA